MQLMFTSSACVCHLMVCAMLVRGVEANGRKPVWCRLDQTCTRWKGSLVLAHHFILPWLNITMNIYLPRLPCSQSDKAVDAGSDHVYWRVNNGGQPVIRIKHTLSFSLLMHCLLFDLHVYVYLTSVAAYRSVMWAAADNQTPSNRCWWSYEPGPRWASLAHSVPTHLFTPDRYRYQVKMWQYFNKM